MERMILLHVYAVNMDVMNLVSVPLGLDETLRLDEKQL